MSFYVEKVSRKSGTCYRIVRDYTRGGERKREYQVLPQGTTKAQAEKIRCQMELEAEFGAYTTKALPSAVLYKRRYSEAFRKQVSFRNHH